MISSNTRATRSRISSPQQAGSNGGSSTPAVKSTGADDQKTFMQRWLEPPVQVRPSYQDAGLVRHGVVEGMAPLGTMPKVGIFKKAVTPAEPTPPRKIVLKRPVPSSIPPTAPTNDPAEDDDTEEEEGEGDGDEEAEEGIPPPPSAALASRRSLTSREADDDEDWAPTRAGATASSGYKSLARRSLVPRASAGRSGSVSSPLQPTSTSGASRASDIKEAADKVVEHAVDEALKHFRYPTAWALRTLYDENSSNPEFLTMVEEVYSQTADPGTLEEFARLVHEKKKEGKKDNKGCYYFVPPSTNNRFIPHKPKRAPYSDLVRLELPNLEEVDGDQKQPDQEADQNLGHQVHPGDSQLRMNRRSAKHPDSPSKMASKTAANGMNGTAKTATPRKTRANSGSSSSSLSSARSMTPPDSIEHGDIFDVPPSRASPAAETSNNVPTPAPQPIVGRRRSNQAKKTENVSPTPQAASSSTTTTAATTTITTRRQQQRSSSATAATPSMPAAVEPPLFPNLSSKKGTQKPARGPIFPSKVGTLDENDAKLRLKLKARNVTNGSGPVPESYSREGTPREALRPDVSRPQMPRLRIPATDAPRPTDAPRSTTRARTSLPATSSSAAGLNLRSTRSSRKRSHDEMDGPVSPATAQFPQSEAASTAANSRAGTPALRPAKKTRTGLRVKSSPMKKKTGTSAGIPRASGERSSPMANGTATKEDDNDDYCSSCGGNGDLVCCDGCTRSFHLSCVDPPLIEDRMPAEWFCNVCRSTRDPASFPAHSGAFGTLLETLDAKNSSAFRLPGSVREYFDGARTGVDGEYEEIVPVPKVTRKRKSDEDQVPDFFRLRDNDGGAALCHACQKATSDNRAIIPCSHCPLWWHLDCLDPPMANPPVLRTWRCPCHVDDILAKFPGALGPAHKFRKIKHAPAISPIFSRGNVNNGFIEIEPEESEDESGWKDVNTFGKTYRLPETGIKLDFFSRARENRKGKPIAPLAASIPRAPTPLPLASRSLEEQQAALNLARLSSQSSTGVNTLVDALLAEADPAVVSLIARGNPDRIENNNLDRFDRQSLHAMLAQIEQMTSRIRGALLPPAEEQHASPAEGDATAVNSEATQVESEHTASGAHDKNLPSPAATEYVTTGTQPKEEKASNDVALPQTPINDMMSRDGDVALEPPSDDQTAVED